MSGMFNSDRRVIPGVTRVTTKIPVERVGVLVGKNGENLKMLKDRLGVLVTVDSQSGSVTIEPASPSVMAYNILKAKEYVEAIGYGFSPDRAEKVLDEDYTLAVIDLKQVIGDSENHLRRIKGRIIGEGGRARRNIEEMTDTSISIYGDYVAIIGEYDNVNVAKQAIEMLIQGRQHSTVYRMIDRMMINIRRRKPELWRREPRFDQF